MILSGYVIAFVIGGQNDFLLAAKMILSGLNQSA
jgi:hypothetical protein